MHHREMVLSALRRPRLAFLTLPGDLQLVPFQYLHGAVLVPSRCRMKNPKRPRAWISGVLSLHRQNIAVQAAPTDDTGTALKVLI